MSKKHVSWLAALAVAATLIAVFLPRQTSQVGSLEPEPLLPGLSEQANTVDWLRITEAGGQVMATLERDAQRWTVVEARGYAADWAVLRPLLAGLAAAQVIEAMTANPEYYDRLGVEDVAGPDAQGLMVEFSADSGLPAVILGKAAQGRDGQYARRAAEAGSVLIDRQLELPRQRVDWLDRSIIDIADDEVVDVRITHADGDTVHARKTSADDEDFTLEGVADGFRARSAWTVNALAGALATLRLDDVVDEDEIDWTGSSRYRLVTADGLDVAVETVTRADPAGEEQEPAQEPENWIRLTAGLYTTGLDTGVDAAADDTAAQQRAQEINQRVQGWAYRIPEYKAASLRKRMADLVQAVDGDS